MGGNFSPLLVPRPEGVSKYPEVSLHRCPFLHQIYLGLTLTLAFTTLSPAQAASVSHLGSLQPPCPPPPVYSGAKGILYSISQFVSLFCSGPSDSFRISLPRANVPSGSGPADLVQIQLPHRHSPTAHGRKVNLFRAPQTISFFSSLNLRTRLDRSSSPSSNSRLLPLHQFSAYNLHPLERPALAAPSAEG